MRKVVLVPVILALLVANASNAQPADRRGLPTFMGHKITVFEPELDPDGFFAKGVASVCVEVSPEEQCYTPTEHFGRFPTVEIIELQKGAPAILFSVASGGVSGWSVQFALLRLGIGKDLRDLFMSDMVVSNQSQYAFWNEPAISDAKIFLTADYTWGPDESHYSPHRYIVSAYVLKRTYPRDTGSYYLEDRYLSLHTYDLEAGADILGAEKQEILARLRRVKATSARP